MMVIMWRNARLEKRKAAAPRKLHGAVEVETGWQVFPLPAPPTLMPSVGTRRSTRVLIPKISSVATVGDGDSSALGSTKTLAVRRHGDKWLGVFGGGRAEDHRCEKREEGETRDLGCSDGLNEFGETAGKTPESDVPEDSCDTCLGRKFGIVYGRRRQRQLSGGGASTSSSAGYRASGIKRRNGLVFVRKGCRKKSDVPTLHQEIKREPELAETSIERGIIKRELKIAVSAGNFAKKNGIMENSLCTNINDRMVLTLFVESSCVSSSLCFPRFLITALKWMRRSTVTVQEFAAVLLSGSIATVFSRQGVHVLPLRWQKNNVVFSSVLHCCGLCKIYGARQSVPLLLLDFSALPIYFKSLHVTMLLGSLYLPRVLTRYLMCLSGAVNYEENNSCVLLEAGNLGTELSMVPVTVRHEQNDTIDACESAIENATNLLGSGLSKHCGRRSFSGGWSLSSSNADALLPLHSSQCGASGLSEAKASFHAEVMAKPSCPEVPDACTEKVLGSKYESDVSTLFSSHRKQGKSANKELKSALAEVKKNIDTARCNANVLVVDADRCWREEGFEVLLDTLPSKEWRIAVKSQGETKFLHKPLNMRRCTVNRFSHAYLWAAEDRWKLEFLDRWDWLVFKELHEECQQRNLQEDSSRTISVPVYREVSGYVDGARSTFIRPDYYIRTEDDEIQRALSSKIARYEMDSGDEKWLTDHNSRILHPGLGELKNISADYFEKIIYAMEKGAYGNVDHVFDKEKAFKFCQDLGKREILGAIYDYWEKKRNKKHTALVREFQASPLLRSLLVHKPFLRKKRSFKRQWGHTPRIRPEVISQGYGSRLHVAAYCEGFIELAWILFWIVFYSQHPLVRKRLGAICNLKDSVLENFQFVAFEGDRPASLAQSELVKRLCASVRVAENAVNRAVEFAIHLRTRVQNLPMSEIWSETAKTRGGSRGVKVLIFLRRFFRLCQMRSEARLDSAVFQLTPTRTRCDLVIIANGKTEKIASGLLNPFLAHLKAAQDQIAKGGYSIILEPDPETDTAWFTKGTVERFVRFVSTPEVLERVTTIESEILQIENAIVIQSNDNLGLSSVNDHQMKPGESMEGIKTSVDSDAEKAIVLYKPGSQSNPPDSNGSTTQEENSKVQLLRVLETRKIVLRKEQGMAFARATAAGFDIDKMVDLIPFAESFGALRLKEACLQFMQLWKKKHESGQWLEVEAAEAMSTQSEFSTLNASGIIFAGDSMMQKDHGYSQSIAGDMVVETDGKAGIYSEHESCNLSESTMMSFRYLEFICFSCPDKQIPSDPKVPSGHQEHLQGQFQHPMYSQWPMHSPPGLPVFQPYPMQGMPYYQNYPVSIPYFHPSYHPTEDPRFNSSHRKGLRRQSMDNKDIESETWERSTHSYDDMDQNTSDLEKEGSHGHKCHKRVGRPGKNKSGVVVIRNINYVTSKKNGAGESESESQSVSESEAEEESDNLHSNMRKSKHEHSSRTSKKEDGRTKPVEYSDAHSNDKVTYGDEADSGNWQAFQHLLLKAEEKSRTVNEDMLAGENEPSKRKQSKGEADPIIPPDRDYGDFHDRKMVGFDSVNGWASRMKQAASDDQLLVSRIGRDSIDNQFKEIENGGGAYRRMSSDEFMMYGQEKHFISNNPSDPLVYHLGKHAVNAIKRSSYNIADESFMLPYRSGSQDLGSDSINAIDMDSEIPSALQKAQNSNEVKSQLSHEPDDLSLVPERGMESVSMGYDPAMDYDFEVPIGNSVKLEAINTVDLSTSIKEASKKSDKEKSSRASNDSMEKRTKDGLVKKEASSRLKPLTEAQKRAEKLRSYKADLQKVKKEREEEELKRLEALKRQRQKSIAARSSSSATRMAVTPQQTKARVAAKPLPSPYKGSKFSDSKPVSSPFHKLPIRTSSIGSSVPQKATKSSKLHGSNHGLTRSLSSLPEIKRESKGLTPEAKADSLRLRRLSDPRGSYTQRASSVKSIASAQVPKRNMPDESRKKITAIMQLDKSKSATLPEIRINSSKTSSDRIKKESVSKDLLQRVTGRKSSQASDSINENLTGDKPPSNSDENPVIEKTVVMLENNVVTAPVFQQLNKTLDTKETSHGEDSCTPIVIDQIEDSGGWLDEQLSSYKVIVPYTRNEPRKFSNSTAVEKNYQAPSSRSTPLDDPVTTNLGNDGGQHTSESEMVAICAVDTMTSISNFENLSLGGQPHETYEKPRGKELKGFRKLLKFGRKSHGSALGEGNIDSDASSVDDQTVGVASSNDVHILKNLIAQDDTNAGGTPAKVLLKDLILVAVSRPFSLLSPFRSKNSEKKPAA
ncbi:hypothetical protein MUK42_18665 [Musa troglodytarum]|uniref:Enhancer of polycomb-like N-terminal domain-containing protein n=1 Tax=Musa troglodytarum TaxID=320322 RepID=A0A9E7JH28_9LILI|nr:hypothetical protein MUK42_18665 [Musa troglodytarum]